MENILVCPGNGKPIIIVDDIAEIKWSRELRHQFGSPLKGVGESHTLASLGYIDGLNMLPNI